MIQRDWTGRVIDGRFPLLEWIGSSGSGAVFRTELPGGQPRRAAIKLVPAGNEDAKARMDDWVAATSLTHPHLMRIFHTGRCRSEQHEIIYVVTEYAEETLSQVLPERPLTPGETREMLKPIVDALSYVHGKKLVYGRLKPANVMVVADQMKLPVDGVHRVGSLWKPNAVPEIYDAPETAAGGISPAADIWSLGVTLVETLTQHPPKWDRSSKTDPIVPESIPQPFVEIARKCLRYDPARRCTVGDIQTILDPNRPLAVAATKSDQTIPPRVVARSEPVKALPKANKGPRVPVLIAAVVVVIVVVALLLVRSHKSEPSSTGPQPPPAATATSPPPSAPSPAQPASPQAATTDGSTGKGEVAQRVMPDANPRAVRTIHGKFDVRIRLTVDDSGKVSDAAFDSHGPSRYFANQALQAARNWTFKPPQVNGRPASSRWILRFEFRRSGIDATAVEVSP